MPRRKDPNSRKTLLQEARQVAPLASVPKELMEVFEQCALGKVPGSIRYLDKRMAVARRHMLHRIRPFLVVQRYPGAQESTAFVVRVEEGSDGSGWLHFIGLPDTTLVDVARGESAQSLADDKGAKVLERLLGGGTSQARELTAEELAEHEKAKTAAKERLPQDLEQALCEHEWDATGVFCLKCRVPKT